MNQPYVLKTASNVPTEAILENQSQGMPVMSGNNTLPLHRVPGKYLPKPLTGRGLCAFWNKPFEQVDTGYLEQVSTALSPSKTCHPPQNEDYNRTRDVTE